MQLIAAIMAGLLGYTAPTTECNLNPMHIGAKYFITSKVGTPDRTMYLWRNDQEVAHQYPQEQITEIWNQVRDGRIRPIRYFESAKRGIEYQPEDINNGKGDKNWQGKFQLISDQQKDAMALVSTEGTGCERVEKYQIKNGETKIELSWLPELKLVQSYSVEQQNQNLLWHLTDLFTNEVQVKAIFHSYDGYQLTDYVDIGDNESDPFLLNLINLGFISHGASGFYDEHGNALGGNHHH
ncbi:hypothetical protein [Hahella ganghwensis]|uniref:hypothetical protein n=1 Tax=Hahella ganghwensis TaxID=286420 RepID=UPI0003606DD7|nr:hypothetical protein [Hahella ganghwensis]